MKTILKNISSFSNRIETPVFLFLVKKILAFLFCYIAGLFLAEGIVILLHFAMGKNMLVGDVFDSRTITLIMYYGYVVVIAVVLFYWNLIEKKSLSAMGVSKISGSYLKGMLLAVWLLFLIISILVLTGNMECSGISEKMDGRMLLLFLGGFMVQGAMEELLCRGFLLHALQEKITLSGAVAVSTGMFIIPHVSSLFAGDIRYGLIGIINLVLISVIFSQLTIRDRNIWAACGLHSFWNFLLYSFLGLNLSGNDGNAAAVIGIQSVEENIWNGGSYGVEAGIITSVVLGLFLLQIRMRGSKASLGQSTL